MRVADVGAHIGFFTLLSSRLVGVSGRVLAFEPSPENFSLLLHHLSRARARNVVPVRAALADRQGTAPLYISPGHSNDSLVQGYTQAQHNVLVETISLDDFLTASGLDSLEFIKIDAEGAEPMILDGMRNTISANPRLSMVIEINPAALAAAGSSPRSLIRQIVGYGFVPRLIAPDGRLLDPHNQSFDGGPNLLCMRAEQWERLRREIEPCA
jgi:FkbM family methyltransferase